MMAINVVAYVLVYYGMTQHLCMASKNSESVVLEFSETNLIMFQAILLDFKHAILDASNAFCGRFPRKCGLRTWSFLYKFQLDDLQMLDRSEDPAHRTVSSHQQLSFPLNLPPEIKIANHSLYLSDTLHAEVFEDVLGFYKEEIESRISLKLCRLQNTVYFRPPNYTLNIIIVPSTFVTLVVMVIVIWALRCNLKRRIINEEKQLRKERIDKKRLQRMRNKKKVQPIDNETARKTNTELIRDEKKKIFAFPEMGFNHKLTNETNTSFEIPPVPEILPPLTSNPSRPLTCDGCAEMPAVVTPGTRSPTVMESGYGGSHENSAPEFTEN